MKKPKQYLISITGPLLERDKEVAEALKERLQGAKVVSCHSLFPDAKRLSDLLHIEIEQVLTTLDDYSEDYLIVYGDNILSLESFRNSLRCEYTLKLMK